VFLRGLVMMRPLHPRWEGTVLLGLFFSILFLFHPSDETEDKPSIRGTKRGHSQVRKHPQPTPHFQNAQDLSQPPPPSSAVRVTADRTPRLDYT
jgi:hypothetical protein